MFEFILTVSPWYILLCLLIGALYAFILYYKESRLSKPYQIILASTRVLCVSLIAFLLTAPLLKKWFNEEEKPVIVLALDNSASVGESLKQDEREKFSKQLFELKDKLNAEDYNVKLIGIDTTLSNEIAFKIPFTNLSDWFTKIEGQNRKPVSAMVLFSDGIYNQGASPLFKNYASPIYTVGLGDTIARKDIALRSLIYNKLSYLGNQYPLVAEISSNGFKGKNIKVSILQNGKIIDSKTIAIDKDQTLIEASFLLTASQKGVQHLVVQITPLEGEFTIQNNSAHAYPEILDGKEKVLILADSPHPDIKAIAEIIASNDNMETDLCIPGIKDYKKQTYDLVIAYQLPKYRSNTNAILAEIQKNQTPIIYVCGTETYWPLFNQQNGVININPSNKVDKINGVINKDFQLFNLSESINTDWRKLAPLSAPFGKYTLQNGSQSIILQTVNDIATDRPLIAFKQTGTQKNAVVCAEGWWQWSLASEQEATAYQSYKDIWLKLIQLVANKDDKRKFRVYPLEEQFHESETIYFGAETFNEIYEKTYGNEINLNIKNEQNKAFSYKFVTNEDNNKISIGALPQGVYNYEAKSKVNGKEEIVKGQFIVKQTDLEQANLQADHNLLRQLSSQTGGKYYNSNQFDNIFETLKKNNPGTQIDSREEVKDFIEWKWLFFILLGLISTEWFVRKFRGAY